MHQWKACSPLSLCLLVLMPLAASGAEFCVSDADQHQTALNTAQGDGEDNVIRILQGTYSGSFSSYSTMGTAISVLGGDRLSQRLIALGQRSTRHMSS